MGRWVGFDDNVFVDFTLTKKFNKFEIGLVGSYETDIDGPVARQSSLAVGGLLGYDFGRFTLQAFATREVYVRNGGWGLGQPGLGAGGLVSNPSSDYETRGTVRVIIPLYVGALGANSRDCEGTDGERKGPKGTPFALVAK